MTVPCERAAPVLVRDFAEADGIAPIVALLADESPETRLDLVLAIWTRLVSGESTGDRLFVAERAGRLVGVAGATIAAGRLAGIRPPVWKETEGDPPRQALFRALEECLNDARVATTFVSRRAGDPLDDDVVRSLDDADRTLFLMEGQAWRRSSESDLVHAGFCDRVELDVLVRDLREDVASEPPSDPGRTWIDASSLPSSQLEELVEATYAGSLDCPVLNGRRSVADVLAGYRVEGDDAVWEVVLEEGAPVGCFFLADHPDTDSMELLYFGVLAAARGRGLGRTIVERALWKAARRGRSAAALSADRDNRPAGEIYRKLGFVRLDRRDVFLKFFPTAVEPPASVSRDNSG